MVKFIVNLKTVDDVNDFMKVVQNIDEDADASTADCGYIVDAKSLVGLISLNFAKPITISINTSDESIVDRFKQWITN